MSAQHSVAWVALVIAVACGSEEAPAGGSGGTGASSTGGRSAGGSGGLGGATAGGGGTPSGGSAGAGGTATGGFAGVDAGGSDASSDATTDAGGSDGSSDASTDGATDASGGASGDGGGLPICGASHRDIRYSAGSSCCGYAGIPATCGSSSNWPTPDACCKYLGYPGPAIYAGDMNTAYKYYSCDGDCGAATADGGGTGGSGGSGGAGGSGGSATGGTGGAPSGNWSCTKDSTSCQCAMGPAASNGQTCGSVGYSCCYQCPIPGSPNVLSACRCNNMTGSCASQAAACAGGQVVAKCPP